MGTFTNIVALCLCISLFFSVYLRLTKSGAEESLTPFLNKHKHWVYEHNHSHTPHEGIDAKFIGKDYNFKPSKNNLMAAVQILVRRWVTLSEERYHTNEFVYHNNSQDPTQAALSTVTS